MRYLARAGHVPDTSRPATLKPMSWIFERISIPSPIQGPITCTRRLGRWDVSVGGIGQTSDHLRSLWKTALYKWLPKQFKAKRILMLGLALGDTLPTYKKRFPDASMTVIEIDPTMVQIINTLAPLKQGLKPEIILNDITTALPTLSGVFDLIIVDVFNGTRVADAASSESVWKHIHRLLAPLGYVFFNISDQLELIKVPKPGLLLEANHFFRFNYVSVYRHTEAGIVGASQPEGYRRMWACPGFIRREIGTRKHHIIMESGSATGFFPTRVPIPIEHYYGDDEPHINARPSSRFILWHPTTRTDVPSSWKQAFKPLHRQLTGYHDLHKNEQYWKEWSNQAQRHRTTWLKQSELVPSRPTMEAFLDAYHRCGKQSSLLNIFDGAIRRHVEGHGERVRFYGVSKQDGTLIAAIATLQVPEIKLEHHITSFMLPEARKTVACTGFLDEWFKDAKTRETRFLEFDGFWTPGEPSSWKGFSAFKAQYVTNYVRYPKSLWKWVRGTTRIDR